MLYLDFEGSLAKGIREIGYLLIENDAIVKADEKTDLEAIKTLEELQLEDVDCIVAHNSSIEKNLIKKYFPYSIDNKVKKIKQHKWLDTLEIYRQLYPKLEKYDLKSLVEIFVDLKELKIISNTVCCEKKNQFHHSLFDAICVYFLTTRLKSVINFNHFLK